MTRSAAVGLGFGFYTTMFSITLSIHGYHLLSIIYFPWVVIAAAFCIILIHFGPDFTTEAYGLSKEFIRQQRINFANNSQVNRKYAERVIRSLRTVGFNCGAIGELTNDRATTYVYSVIENSITCILLTGDFIAHYNIS